jgi:hypothetical protein
MIHYFSRSVAGMGRISVTQLFPTMLFLINVTQYVRRDALSFWPCRSETRTISNAVCTETVTSVSTVVIIQAGLRSLLHFLAQRRIYAYMYVEAIFKRCNVSIWTGLSWLRLETGGGQL